MSERKSAAGADELAMAEGQAAVEAIVETEAAADEAGGDGATKGQPTPRRRRRPKTDKVADGCSRVVGRRCQPTR